VAAWGSAAVPELVHGTAIALILPDGPRAALIRGASGSGKSDLALRCLAAGGSALVPEACRLVADDQVKAERIGEAVVVSPPSPIRGRIEVRGLGIVDVATCDGAVLTLIVDLVPRSEVPRLPDPVPCGIVAGGAVQMIRLHAFDASTPLKILITLREPGILRV
jgi:hypothetical protein